ncbi:Crp/Fnr family transcriptional regulator [Amycolatopsis sp. NPDC059657]|uniref:Crp/Fnr family transcriptional regulator n=1 Tax=Amycolatopsis sp. NPDC059657 TaxID=3346899 RepID=UPI00366B742C
MPNVLRVGGSEFDQYLATAMGDWSTASFLSELCPRTLTRLIAAGEVHNFSAGERLIIEGEQDKSVYLLLGSYVKVVARFAGKGEALLAIRVGGDVVGEQAVLDGSPRSATVVACGRKPVVAVRVEAAPFEAILAEDVQAMRRLVASVSLKLRAANRKRIDYTAMRAPERLARALVELAKTCGRPTGTGGVLIHANLTQLELGTLVGVQRAAAERALAELRKDHLIEPGRHPIIPDLAALRARAGLDPSNDGKVD